jgi:hypothetical protein
MSPRRRVLPSTTARGLGWEHQKLRAAALAALIEGTLCELCGRPMYRVQKLDLDQVMRRAVGGEGRRRMTPAGCNRSRDARWGTGGVGAGIRSRGRSCLSGDRVRDEEDGNTRPGGTSGAGAWSGWPFPDPQGGDGEGAVLRARVVVAGPAAVAWRSGE